MGYAAANAHAVYSPAERREQVLALAEALVGRYAAPHQRELLATALLGLRDPALDDPPFQFAAVHVPLLVYAALRGDDEPAHPLAAATALLHLGIDVFDDLADGDLPGHWAGHRPAEINLAAATLLAALPQLALTDIPAPPTRLVAMQRSMAQGALRLSAGQQRDLAMAGSDGVSPGDVEASVVDKSGEELAMYAALAAHFAGAPPRLVDLYATLGREIGTGRQFAEDCYDLFAAPHSRDLAAGTRTLPIALYLERLPAEERAGVLVLLDEARTDPAAQDALRRRLRRAGILRQSAIIIEVYCQRARRLLEQAAPREPGHGGLHALIDVMSFFPRRGVAGDEETTKEVGHMA